MGIQQATLQSVCQRLPDNASLYEKLNSRWHERALKFFMVVVLAHWAEHLTQAYQVYFMGWPRVKAGGLLGLWYPCLVHTEVLHYVYALVMLVGIWLLREGFGSVSRKWWTAALVIQFWHHIEHALLIGQATLHHNLWGKPVPTSILQLVVPRIELHLFYNSIVFLPMVIGMYHHVFSKGRQSVMCTCSWHPPKT